DGGASTLPTLSRFSIRRSSAGTSTLSYFVDSFAKRVPASLAAWLARAAIASVSSVMKFCCTQPACACWTPSFSVVSFAVSRNVFASAAVPGDDEEAVFVQPRAAPRGDYRRTLDAVVGLVGDIEHAIGARATVGVGIPGTISPSTGLVRNANSTWLIGQPLADDLPRLLDRPVRFANDANCFALSEASDGAAAGAAVVFGVIVGTGCGGGVVVNGAVLAGANGVAGEWGHNPMPAPRDTEWPGPPCYCGRRGCIEQFLSGPALARDHREAGGAAG